jgi:hypothetical protein
VSVGVGVPTGEGDAAGDGAPDGDGITDGVGDGCDVAQAATSRSAAGRKARRRISGKPQKLRIDTIASFRMRARYGCVARRPS